MELEEFCAEAEIWSCFRLEFTKRGLIADKVVALNALRQHLDLRGRDQFDVPKPGLLDESRGHALAFFQGKAYLEGRRFSAWNEGRHRRSSRAGTTRRQSENSRDRKPQGCQAARQWSSPLRVIP